MFQADAISLNEYAIALQRNQLDIVRTTRDKLRAARREVEKRFERYDSLYNGGLFHNERAKIVLSIMSQVAKSAAKPLEMFAAALDTAPNIAGLALGGHKPSAPPRALSIIADFVGDTYQMASEGAGWQAEIDRRYQEWDFERQAATYELDTLDEEIRAQTLQIDAEKTALKEVLDRHELMKKEYIFMTTGFAIGPTYVWMIAHLSNIYAAAYDAVYALCEAANAAFDFETDLRGTRYIWPSAWLDAWRGMLAGEQFERQLLQMHANFLQCNERRMLIELEVSLAMLLGKGDPAEGLKKIIESLNSETPSLSFELTPALFDDDYPGHYLRRIKHISIALSFPDNLIPMAGAAAAVLTQKRSTILIFPDAEGVTWLYATTDERKTLGEPHSLWIDLLPGQCAAVSAATGNTDITTHQSVLGRILFDDDRRLAFEGTGAISSWTLEFTGRLEALLDVLWGPKQAGQRPKTWRLEDIKVRLHYTAAPGPEDFVTKVKTTRNGSSVRGTRSQRWMTRTLPLPGSTSLGGGLHEPVVATNAEPKQASAGSSKEGSSTPASAGGKSPPPDRTGSGSSDGSTTPPVNTGSGSTGDVSTTPGNTGGGSTSNGSTTQSNTGGGATNTPSKPEEIAPLLPTLPSGATPIAIANWDDSDATQDPRWPRVRQFVEAMLGLVVLAYATSKGDLYGKGVGLMNDYFKPYMPPEKKAAPLSLLSAYRPGLSATSCRATYANSGSPLKDFRVEIDVNGSDTSNTATVVWVISATPQATLIVE